MNLFSSGMSVGATQNYTTSATCKSFELSNMSHYDIQVQSATLQPYTMPAFASKSFLANPNEDFSFTLQTDPLNPVPQNGEYIQLSESSMAVTSGVTPLALVPVYTMPTTIQNATLDATVSGTVEVSGGQISTNSLIVNTSTQSVPVQQQSYYGTGAEGDFNPTYGNYISNSGFLAVTNNFPTNWTSGYDAGDGVSTSVVSGSTDGGNILELSYTTAANVNYYPNSPAFSVSPSTEYTVSGKLKLVSGTCNYELYVFCLDSSQTLISQGGSGSIAIPTTETLESYTFTTPTNCAYVWVRYVFVSSVAFVAQLSSPMVAPGTGTSYVLNPLIASDTNFVYTGYQNTVGQVYGFLNTSNESDIHNFSSVTIPSDMTVAWANPAQYTLWFVQNGDVMINGTIQSANAYANGSTTSNIELFTGQITLPHAGNGGAGGTAGQGAGNASGLPAGGTGGTGTAFGSGGGGGGGGGNAGYATSAVALGGGGGGGASSGSGGNGGTPGSTGNPGTTGQSGYVTGTAGTGGAEANGGTNGANGSEIEPTGTATHNIICNGNIYVVGSILANGSDGGTGGAGGTGEYGGGGGGGAGGSGGGVVVLYASKAVTVTGTINVNGGAGGAGGAGGTGTSTSGTAGSTGSAGQAGIVSIYQYNQAVAVT